MEVASTLVGDTLPLQAHKEWTGQLEMHPLNGANKVCTISALSCSDALVTVLSVVEKMTGVTTVLVPVGSSFGMYRVSVGAATNFLSTIVGFLLSKNSLQASFSTICVLEWKVISSHLVCYVYWLDETGEKAACCNVGWFMLPRALHFEPAQYVNQAKCFNSICN